MVRKRLWIWFFVGTLPAAAVGLNGRGAEELVLPHSRALAPLDAASRTPWSALSRLRPASSAEAICTSPIVRFTLGVTAPAVSCARRNFS